MARAIIISHGKRTIGKDETFVPAGKSLSLYVDYDTNSARFRGLGILAAGDVEPTEVYAAEAVVPNYGLQQQTDEGLLQYMSSETSNTNGTVYYVGPDLANPISLCSSPVACRATFPNHAPTCTGLFNSVAENDIHGLFCRGTSSTSPTSTEFEGSQEFYDDDLKPMMIKMINGMRDDPVATISYWETLPQGTQAMLRTAVQVRTAIDGYYAGGGATTPEAVLEARRYLEAYGDATFYSWVAEMGEGTRQSMIRADDALEAAFQRGWADVDPRGKLFDGADPVTADPSVVLLAQIDQQAIALAVAVSMFSGAGEDDISDASSTYVAVMEQIGAYQQSPGASPSTAASLNDVGAAIGPALAAHGEQQDADSLATLTSGVELLCQWTSSLVTA